MGNKTKTLYRASPIEAGKFSHTDRYIGASSIDEATKILTAELGWVDYKRVGIGNGNYGDWLLTDNVQTLCLHKVKTKNER